MNLFSRIYEKILLEFDLSKTVEIYKEKLDARGKEDRSFPGLKKEKKLEADLKRGDPTPSQEYSRWILQVYSTGGISRWEDVVSRVRPALEKYHKLKNKKKIEGDQRNIFNLKTLTDLEDLVDKFKDEPLTGKDLERANLEKAKEESKLEYSDSNVVVIVPNTPFAATFWGKGSRWCTTNPGMFSSYSKRADLHIMIPKKPAYEGEKYQIFLMRSGSGDWQAANEKDAQVKLTNLLDRFGKEPFMSMFDVSEHQLDIASASPRNGGFYLSFTKEEFEQNKHGFEMAVSTEQLLAFINTFRRGISSDTKEFIQLSSQAKVFPVNKDISLIKIQKIVGIFLKGKLNRAFFEGEEEFVIARLKKLSASPSDIKKAEDWL